MNEIIQWLLVVAAVAGSAAFLIRRAVRPSGGCCDRCASCPVDRTQCDLEQQKPRFPRVGSGGSRKKNGGTI